MLFQPCGATPGSPRPEGPQPKIAVAGATGRVGQHVVAVLIERGYDVVPMSRSQGVDVITGNGLAAALAGVDCVIDTATGPSPEQQAATTFFITAAQNLHQAGQRAGVQRMIVVSIIGTDRFTAGYGAAKIAHEQAMLSGPIPVRVLRAAQFYEFVGQMVEWGVSTAACSCHRRIEAQRTESAPFGKVVRLADERP
jgi:uncharacterized protein YbjT (DUF2867 family)